MPQEQAHQMHMITLSSFSSGSGVFGKTITRRWAFMIASCFLTASVNGSTFSSPSQNPKGSEAKQDAP